jgi:hypothetical protein
MESKKHIVTISEYPDHCTVSEFAQKFKIQRAKVYQLIEARLLSGIVISGTFYPSFEDKTYIMSLLSHNKQGDWPRSYRPGKRDELDSAFERAWREDQGM